MSESSQKLDLIRHALEGARSSLPLPECADLACDLKAEIEATTAKTQALSSPAGTIYLPLKQAFFSTIVRDGQQLELPEI